MMSRNEPSDGCCRMVSAFLNRDLSIQSILIAISASERTFLRRKWYPKHVWHKPGVTNLWSPGLSTVYLAQVEQRKEQTSLFQKSLLAPGVVLAFQILTCCLCGLFLGGVQELQCQGLTLTAISFCSLSVSIFENLH